MLDRHDTVLLEQLVRVVVDQLPVDEHVATVLDDPLHLGLHLLLFCLFDLGHSLEGIHFDPRPVDLHLVRVHLAIRDQDLAILQDLGLPHADLLLEDEPLFQEGVLQRPTGLLDHLYVVEVGLAVQSQHSVHREDREVVLLVLQELRAEGRPGYLEEILTESGCVFPMVHRQPLELLPRHRKRHPVALDDHLGVHLLLDEHLRVAQHLGRQDDDRGCPIAALVVLRLRDVHQNLRGWVVDPHRLEDGCPIVGHGGVAAGALPRHGLQDLVHALGAHGAADRLRDSLGRQDVGFVRLEALQALLLLLLLHDDEGVPVLVHGQLAHVRW
mmetsp:Transcript_61446/g.138293  ORF Transcript_61446/g.138293 Transcript_61446/m.138293 type:complete len:327 (-) Transcript_61446:103-1083(-)